MNKGTSAQSEQNNGNQNNQTSTLISWNKLIITAIAILLFKSIIAFKTRGTNDVNYYEAYELISERYGIKVYNIILQEGKDFTYFINYPPFAIHISRILKILASITTIKFAFWFRFLCSLADFGNLILVAKILK